MKHEINSEIILRKWSDSDESALVNLANNEKLARNMLDTFPHPYTPKDARAWIDICKQEKSNELWAIEYKGQLAGGIGAHFKDDIFKYSVELGYWVGEPFWGKGIASSSVSYFCEHIFSNYKINRIYGEVFEHNEASMKVLEKNGFIQEAQLKKAAFKKGFFIDLFIYSKLK